MYKDVINFLQIVHKSWENLESEKTLSIILYVYHAIQKEYIVHILKKNIFLFQIKIYTIHVTIYKIMNKLLFGLLELVCT